MKKMYDTENLYSAFHQFIKVGGERIWASRSYFAFRQKHNQKGIVCFTFHKIKKFLKSLIFGVDYLFDISDI